MSKGRWNALQATPQNDLSRSAIGEYYVFRYSVEALSGAVADFICDAQADAVIVDNPSSKAAIFGPALLSRNVAARI